MLREHVHRVLRLLVPLIVATLTISSGVTVSCANPWADAPRPNLEQLALSLIAPRRSIADLLAHPPAAGQTVEVDAYFSGAGNAPAGGSASSPSGQAPAAMDWGAILSDRPFAAQLSLLGGVMANALPDDAAWFLVATPTAATAGALAPRQLPYYARFRGHLGGTSAAAQGPAVARVFTVEQVVHTYAARPPEARAAVDYGGWPRYHNAEAGYSVPYPPGWRAERVDGATLELRASQWPNSPVSLRVHSGETHPDPYDPASAPPLLSGQTWSTFQQGSGLSREGPAQNKAGPSSQRLAGYRTERDGQPGERTVAVLFSGSGKTYEMSLRCPLGFAASQPLLNAYAAIVAGFRLDVPPAPSPTPPVQQVLGPGPFVSEEEALTAACDQFAGEIEPLGVQLVSEAEARRLAGSCAAFGGHTGGVWVLSLRTPRAARTHTMRLFLDAATGRPLCSEEIEASAAPTLQPKEAGGPAPAPSGSRRGRWIEVNLGEQTLTAWEGDTLVRKMLVSTGLEGVPTVTGQFHIYRKLLSMTMSGPGYSLPGVPHVMFFHENYALHGAYWHNNFGTPMSHGCVNLRLDDAAWLFDWATPRLPQGDSTVDATVCNPGTLVVIH